MPKSYEITILVSNNDNIIIFNTHHVDYQITITNFGKQYLTVCFEFSKHI